MMLSFLEIKELIGLVSERGFAGLEVEQDGLYVRIEGIGRPASPAPSSPVPVSVVAGENVHVITSPIVGTFYRAPSPESAAFIELGQKIKPGQVLCIIESMKLMNEIESDVEGEVVAVYPRNGQPVEYGEKLFAIRLAA